MASNMNDPNRGTHGTSTVTPVTEEKKSKWWLWLLPLLLLIPLIWFLTRDRDEQRVEQTTTTETTAVDPAAAPAAGLTGETAAAGVAAAGAAASGNVLADMQAYLASTEAAGRRFTFDNIHFATNSAELPADASATINGVVQALQASPNARIRVEGYADARGAQGANAQLGAQRAQAVAAALTSAGIAQNRVETATGGEQNPVDTNATAEGQADNRRTDIVVTAK
jgi:outer membrane protein OmpA-like peptidoglycan-associated protein